MTNAQRRKNRVNSIGKDNPNIKEAISRHEDYLEARTAYTQWLAGEKTFLSVADDTDFRREKVQLHNNIGGIYEHSKDNYNVDVDDVMTELGVTADLNPFADSYDNSSVWETYGINKNNDDERMATEWDLWGYLFGKGVTEPQTDHSFIDGNEWWGGGEERNEWATFGRRRLHARAEMEYRAKRLIDYMTTGREDGTWKTAETNGFLTELADLTYIEQAVVVHELTMELDESYFGSKFLRDQLERPGRHAGYTYTDDAYETTGSHPNETKKVDGEQVSKGPETSYPKVLDPINLFNPYVEPAESKSWANSNNLPVADGSDNPIYTISDKDTYQTYFEPGSLVFSCFEYTGSSSNQNNRSGGNQSINMNGVTEGDGRRAASALVPVANRFLASANLKQWSSFETQFREQYFTLYRLVTQRISPEAAYGTGPWSRVNVTADGQQLFQSATSVDLSSLDTIDFTDEAVQGVGLSRATLGQFLGGLATVAEDVDGKFLKNVFAIPQGFYGMVLSTILIVEGGGQLSDIKKFTQDAITFMQGVSSGFSIAYGDDATSVTSKFWRTTNTGLKGLGHVMNAVSTALTAYATVSEGFSGDTDTAVLYGLSTLAGGIALGLAVTGATVGWPVTVGLAVFGAATYVTGSLIGQGAMVDWIASTTFGEHHDGCKEHPPKSNVSNYVIGDYERWWINGFRFRENIFRQLGAFQDLTAKHKRIRVASVLKRDTSDVNAAFDDVKISSAYYHTGHVKIDSVRELDGQGHIYIRMWDIGMLELGHASRGRNETMHRIKLDANNAQGNSEALYELNATGQPPVLEYRVRKEDSPASGYKKRYHLLISSAQNASGMAYEHIYHSPNPDNEDNYCLEAIYVPNDRTSEVETVRTDGREESPYSNVAAPTEWFPKLVRHTYYLS